MDLSVVATATSVLSNAITAMKYVREVSDGTDDLELKSRINDLYTALLDVRATVLDLDEENRALRSELAKKHEIVGPNEPFGYFFYKDKPDKPLCPKCLQSQPKNVVFLPASKTFDQETYRFCIICNTEFTEITRPNGSSW